MDESTIATFPIGRRALETSLTDLSDEELISLSRTGDPEAFGEFVRRHMPAVHRWMARAVGDGDANTVRAVASGRSSLPNPPRTRWRTDNPCAPTRRRMRA